MCWSRMVERGPESQSERPSTAMFCLPHPTVHPTWLIFLTFLKAHHFADQCPLSVRPVWREIWERIFGHVSNLMVTVVPRSHRSPECAGEATDKYAYSIPHPYATLVAHTQDKHHISGTALQKLHCHCYWPIKTLATAGQPEYVATHSPSLTT